MVRVPADWMDGFHRAGYVPLSAPPADLVALFTAFERVDEDGRRRRVVGSWCPAGHRDRVR